MPGAGRPSIHRDTILTANWLELRQCPASALHGFEPILDVMAPGPPDGLAEWTLLPPRTPPPMEKPFYGGKECLIDGQPDHDDDQHDPNDLIHRIQFTPIVE